MMGKWWYDIVCDIIIIGMSYDIENIVLVMAIIQLRLLLWQHYLILEHYYDLHWYYWR